MDSTKLKQFLLLKELEQQQITVNHDKLRRLDSGRKPNIIFESGGTKTDNAWNRRGSSTASSDSGFPISPSPPPSANFKTPKSDVFPHSSTMHALGEQSDDELDVPPLPTSHPPEVLMRPFSPDATSTLNSSENNTFLTQTTANDNRESYDSQSDSTDTSSYDSSEESDSCNHYVVTEETSQQNTVCLLPFEISKLEGSVKTVRSKIKPGTVQNITTIFSNKARRIKRENKRRKRKPFLRNSKDGENRNNTCIGELNKTGDHALEIVGQERNSKSPNNDSEHEIETDDTCILQKNTNVHSQSSDSEDVLHFAFSGQNQEYYTNPTGKTKSQLGDNKRYKDGESNFVNSCISSSATDDIGLGNKALQTTSVELKEVSRSINSDNEKTVGVHQCVCENEIVKNKRNSKEDVNFIQDETQASKTPSSLKSIASISDGNTGGFVDKFAVCNIYQTGKRDSDIPETEITESHTCLDNVQEIYAPSVNEILDGKSEISSEKVFALHHSPVPDLRRGQSQTSRPKLNENRQETDSESSEESDLNDSQEENKYGSPEIPSGGSREASPCHTAGSVEDGILDLQKAVERNNALLSRNLKENSKLLDSLEDDVESDSSSDDNVHSNGEYLISAVNSCQNDVSFGDKQTKSHADMEGGYKSVINLEGDNNSKQPQGTVSHKEEIATVDLRDVQKSTASTDAVVYSSSPSNENHRDLLDYNGPGSMEGHMKNNNSLNDSSVSGECTFQTNSTSLSITKLASVETVSPQTKEESRKYAECVNTAPQINENCEKVSCDSTNLTTNIVNDTGLHGNHVRIICHDHQVNQDDGNDRAKVIQQECENAENKVYESKTLPFVKCNPLEKERSEAYLARGTQRVSGVTANVSTYATPYHQVSEGSTHPSGEQQSSSVPEFYALPGSFKTDKIVSLKELSGIARSMPDRYSGYTSSGSDSSSYTGGRKVRTKTTTLRSGRGGDRAEENLDIESNTHLKHLAETISKLNGENNDELLPEINQTVTKLPGGNLVITTLTHKIVEEEDDEKKVTHPPQTEEDDRRYIVQDHKGNYYMVEDITDESQESAYFSTSSESHNTSDGFGYSGQNFQGIYNLQAVGRSGIDHDTAEEVLLGLYNPGGYMQIQEIDERTGEGHYLREHYRPGGQCGTMSSDTSYNKQLTSYDETDKVHRPIPQTIGSSSVKTVRHSYEMEKEEGDQEGYRRSEAMQTSQSHADNTGISNSNSSYMMEASALMYPPVLPPPVIMPPPIVPQPPVPVCHMAVVDVTPSPPKIEETREERTEKVEVRPKDVERPIYKSVALVKGPYEAPKWQKQRREFIPAEIEDKKCVVLNSRATEDRHEETVEEVTTKEYYTMKMSSGGVTEDGFHNRSSIETQAPHKFKTEKVFQINGSAPSPIADRHFKSKFNVTTESRPVPISNESRQTFSTKYQVKNDFDRHHDAFPRHHDAYQRHHETYQGHQSAPQRLHDVYQGHHDIYQNHTGEERDIHVVRGNILIKNNLDQDLDEYNDNINLFDQAFNMTKENPVYHSDEDIYKRFEREREQERAHNQRFQDSLNNDITFETVDRFTKCKEVKRQPRPKKNLSELLLSKLATIDSKDIRQHIDVKHHHEDIYGDISLIHADGSRAGQNGTSNFDSVAENVDLMLKNGKAFITVTVTAERITPIDIEFNVWRKNQAIVTRVIEIDFFANEQRRRLYETVMERAQTRETGNGGYTYVNPRETMLSSEETLDLFTEIMDTTDGEGDKEDITVRKSQKKTRIPGNNLDFLY
ncbi:uncharacterized protein LOC133173029 [Saccostrea echinata]|uniref:uncharacterized protein LOC133173029 n=1 Tax=Saccostrea echinata TaxID=191078 RepID=UPI002A8108E0|nr:uncharacterized protein LOC133173029 [Saccostrea echinata]